MTKILTILWCLLFCTISADPIVTTKYGTVYGQTYVSRDGTPVDIYQGIPFAKPPVGKLRFEKPQPPDRWFQPLITQKYAPGCIPCMAMLANPSGTVSEDCLYLNVWTPSNENNAQNISSKLPVMVYIHGGAFYMGQAFGFDPKKFADIYASQGIVVVTIQYRLAQFGFMTLNNTVLPANIGMWDQNMALQWVKGNIEYFRGDPSRITIWGESAGAMSVSQHTISPYSRDLFQQSIQASGSTFGAVGDNKNTIPYTKQLIGELGCANETNIKSCLQAKSVTEFQSAAVKLNYCVAEDITSLALAPIQDGIFWPTNYDSLVTKDHSKPTMIGLNQVEGRLFSLYEDPSLKPMKFKFALLKSDWESYNDTSFQQFLSKFVTTSGYSNYSQTALGDIVKFASKNGPSNQNDKFWISQFVQIISDFLFVVPSVRELVAKSAAGYPTYAFLLDHFNQKTWPVDYPVQGSTHMGEFPYVFEKNGNFAYTEADDAVKKAIQEGIIAFLKTGSPSTPSVKWNQFGFNMTYLSLQQNSTMTNGFFADAYNFWTKTMRKYDFDFITQSKWQN